MKKTLLILSIFFIITVLNCLERDTIYVVHTTDVHGNLLAYDYYKDQPAENGLSKLHSFLQEFRAEHANVILLDGGDMIQGTPLSYLYNRVETTEAHPLIAAMNFLGYDAMAVGNHEIEQGLATCNRLREGSSFPWLSANSVTENDLPYFEPYKIIEVSGLKIAMLGLTTPGIPKWLEPHVYEGITWQDMVKISQEYMPELKEKADIIIGLFHAGLEAEGPYPGLPEENAAGLVAEQVAGFDIILGGHTHRTIPEEKQTITDPKKTFQLISGSHARSVGIIKLIVETSDEARAVVEKTGWAQSLQDYPGSDEMIEMFAKYHDRTLQFIRRELTETGAVLTTENAYFRDNPMIELINQVQMEKSGAEISFASCFNPELIIPPGPVRVKDIYTIYPYENFLYTVKMSGEQIDTYLEYAARFYTFTEGEAGRNPDIAGYNYDIAEGIAYEIDLNKSVGDRIDSIILQATGDPLVSSGIYTVALNSFRGSGGGGYLTAIGAESPRIYFKSDQEIRNMIIEYLAAQEGYVFKVNNNWKLKVINKEDQ